MIAEAGAEAGDVISYRTAAVSGLITNGTVELDVSKVDSIGIVAMSDVWQFYFVPLSDFNEAVGESIALDRDEALVSVYRGEFEGDTLSFNGGKSFRVDIYDGEYFDTGESAMLMTPSMMIIVPDLEYAVEGIENMTYYNGGDTVQHRMLQYRMKYDFNTDLDADGQIDLGNAIYNKIRSTSTQAGYMEVKYGVYYSSVGIREENRQDFYGMYGTLFYIGIILSIVFIFAAVLIIYYKQLSEGYEDQARFEIMQKVGMTKREIKKSINSQLLTVFFLPLAFAAMHVAFAFPIIRKLLMLFDLNNVMLFAMTTGISMLVFAVFYTIVYKLTAGAYYNIVSGAKRDDYGD